MTFNNISLISVFSPPDVYLRAHPEKVPRYRFFQHSRFRASPYPRKFDWRDHGAVGPIHNQKSVGVSKQEVILALSVDMVNDLVCLSCVCVEGSAEDAGHSAWSLPSRRCE